MVHAYDVIVFGGGVAGLFVAARLRRAGYSVIVVEKETLGGVQTLASQGMIHGGQKYALTGHASAHTASIAAMPARWDACFAGAGEVDLSDTVFLSDHQLMFPAGSWLSSLSAWAAARAVRGRTQRVARPEMLPRGPVYRMEEKVLDVKSLVAALAQVLDGYIFKGTLQDILPDGQVLVSGLKLRAQMIVVAAGTGNEEVLRRLKIEAPHTQRRPLRQIMVKPMAQALYGHGIVGKPKPRVTVTSHPLGDGQYVWYLGGALAEAAAHLDEEAALRLAQHEMRDIFPQIGWHDKEWASWYGDRAEPFDAAGHLPPGPHIQQRGKILLTWPTKLTFAPALADQVLERLKRSDIHPSAGSDTPELSAPAIGAYPWEAATWQRL